MRTQLLIDSVSGIPIVQVSSRTPSPIRRRKAEAARTEPKPDLVEASKTEPASNGKKRAREGGDEAEQETKKVKADEVSTTA